MEKLGAFLISLVIALIVFNAVLVVISLTIGIPFLSNQPDARGIIIAAGGLIIAAYLGILTFKKVYRYFKSELRNLEK